jgi:hypothetical protein
MLYLFSNVLIHLVTNLPLKSVYGSHTISLTHRESMCYALNLSYTHPRNGAFPTLIYNKEESPPIKEDSLCLLEACVSKSVDC